MPLPKALLPALDAAFLVFEGPDGSGKSTQLRRFAAACRESGLAPVEVREPGGTHIGERLRALLLEHGPEDIAPRCEMLLYMASRAQLVERVIAPALARRGLVLADRFVASTVAYQGAGGGVPYDDIAAVGRVAIGAATPTLVIVFDVDPDTAASRLSPLLDRMEAKGRAFHERVRAGYRRQAELDPARFLVIDAARGEDAVFADLITGLTRRLVEGRP